MLKIKKYLVIAFFLFPWYCFAQFPPPAGQAGSTAIYKDSSVIVGWATGCKIIRGWQNIADTTLGKVDAGDSSMATGAAGTNGVVSLGDGGVAILSFDHPIINGNSWDFAVFENSFSDNFLELAFVEVSSDGVNFFRFPSTSLTDTNIQIASFGELDATKINNLAGKYRVFYGTPFDLQELAGISLLDINNITHVKIIDVVGSIDNDYATYDALNHKINDPWPTPFSTSGFDLDAVGVINQNVSSVSEHSENNFIVYPNPVNDLIYIRSENISLQNELSIYNCNGQLLLESLLLNQLECFDLAVFPPGVYIIKIKDPDVAVFRKIIKN